VSRLAASTRTQRAVRSSSVMVTLRFMLTNLVQHGIRVNATDSGPPGGYAKRGRSGK
jgi:hypothetical protein